MKSFSEFFNFQELSSDEQFSLIRDAISDPDADPKFLDEVARKTADSSLLVWISYNVNALPETLDFLSRSSWWTVREGVAGNPNTPMVALERLRKDPDWMVRRVAQGTYATLLNKVDETQ